MRRLNGDHCTVCVDTRVSQRRTYHAEMQPSHDGLQSIDSQIMTLMAELWNLWMVHTVCRLVAARTSET